MKESRQVSGAAKVTIDHAEIQRWAEERGGHPAAVKRTPRKADDAGILRIDFPGWSGERTLRPISWDQFFETFDRSQLAFIYQDRIRGQQSRFNKLVSRQSVAVKDRLAAANRVLGGGNPRPDSEARYEREVSTDGLQDAVSLLEEQHRQVERLFDRLDRARDKRTRQRTFAELAELLLTHANLEEQIFYPAVEERQTRPFLLHSAEEHLSMKRLMADMFDLDASDESWRAKCRVLREQIDLHVGEEEREVFPHAREILDEEQLAGLAQEMTALWVELLVETEPAEAVREQIYEAATL